MTLSNIIKGKEEKAKKNIKDFSYCKKYLLNSLCIHIYLNDFIAYFR